MLSEPATERELAIGTQMLPPMQRASGEGRLSVSSAGGQTRVRDLFQQGCAKMRLPRATTDRHGREVVLINSSGGVTGGDHLQWSLDVGEGAMLTATTQACEKIYRSNGDDGVTDINIRVRKNASMAWLPQETILFDEARLRRTINVDLDATSRFLMVEAVLFGRQAMAEAVTDGRLLDRWRIRQGGRLVHAEQMHLFGDIHAQMAVPAIGNDNLAFATIMLIASEAEGLLEPLRRVIGPNGAVSYVNSKLIARLVAPDGYTLRRTLVPVIELAHHGGTVPKVWMI